jgi:hypothetical protein
VQHAQCVAARWLEQGCSQRKKTSLLRAAGEASSNTFTAANGIYLRGFKGDMPMAQWAGALGANATMPALLREAQPYLRLILLLRSPVNRSVPALCCKVVVCLRLLRAACARV